MSTTQQAGSRTPQRSSYNMFDNNEQSTTITPCTRLSRMTIESTSNSTGGGRLRTSHFQQLPVSNFNDKLMQVVREESTSTKSTPHRNLDMFLGSDRISMFDKSKDHNVFSYSEDEDSDEGDLFSSSLCSMSSPERGLLTRQSIFDDESMNTTPSPIQLNRKSIFDDEDDQDIEQIEEDGDYYDPSSAWLTQIYSDNDTSDMPISTGFNSNTTTTDDSENRKPRFSNKQQEKTRRILPHEEDNTLINQRLPLREIRFEDYLSEEEEEITPAKKKYVLKNGKAHKMRFMRTLSPPRYAKRKVNLL